MGDGDRVITHSDGLPLTVNERRDKMGLPPIEEPMDCMVSTSPEWWTAVEHTHRPWVQKDAGDGIVIVEFHVPMWVHSIGLVLRGRYTSAHHRKNIWPLYIAAMVSHESAVRAAYRLGGPMSAVQVAGQVAFG